MKIKYSKQTTQRLDKFLAEELDLSRTKTQEMIKDGLVVVNKKAPAVHQFLKVNDEIEYKKTLIKKPVVKKTIKADPTVKFKVVFESPDYLIIEKPAGIIVHPTEKMESHTLAAGLLAKFPELKKVGENPVRPGIVHRLDKEVSGLMIVPRTQDSFEYFKNLLKNRQVKKIYTALVHGDIDREEGFIDLKIGRSRTKGKMAAYPTGTENAKEAFTHFVVIERFKYLTLLSVEIMTGRTHQIRVHLNALNHPVIGDKLYTQKFLKRKYVNLDRLFLHASELEFIDPSGKTMNFKSALPKELVALLSELRNEK